MKHVKLMSKGLPKAAVLRDMDCEGCMHDLTTKGKSTAAARRACERKGDC